MDLFLITNVIIAIALYKLIINSLIALLSMLLEILERKLKENKKRTILENYKDYLRRKL